jgi:predicted ATP-grasp superfamily ATP-dependent carboligase
MLKVGILDGQSIQAVICAKQLSNAGYKVVLFCDSKFSSGYFTKYGDERIVCPSTQTETKKFHKFFTKYLTTEKLDVVLPMNDYSAKYLSEYKLELQSLVKFIIPDLEIFMNGYDKNKLMKICEKHNFPHPKTIDISSLEKGNSDIDFTFPALIKPNETTGARGFTKVNNFKELWKNYDAIYNEFGACHLQELIPMGGKQYKVQILISNNIVINTTVIEKIRYYPVGGGSSCFNKTIINNNLVDICTNVLKILKWEGFADFDLIEDPRDGVIKIMEINPRIPACIKASVISGVDFPNAIVDLSLNKNCENYAYKSGKYLRYFSMDFLWLLSSKNKLKDFKEWIKKMFSVNQFLQDGDLLDPMPFIIGLFSGLVKQLNPKFRNQKKGMSV